ncbi:TetR/AcrR family transcriptional regulator C-terminal domain-containing protein [Streptosporangium oxazolinicum]|uniref:TetR/AcrR family transcriptional regulator C-terminal domain-containing protein n=1 Tax=Streptosporangium oxazolinicum TaxID=909287 RepID=A0ABP8BD02_9ACTN
MTSLWERLERADKSARPTLSAHRIARAAVDIADADGLDAITMRRLATELGVGPMAAYRHVSGRDDVVELMVDLVYGEVDVPRDAGWRETMRALALGVHALVLKHAWLTQLSTAQAAYELTPNRMALAERTLAALRETDLDVDTAITVFRTVTAYVHGATAAEVGLRRLASDRGWATGDETRTGLSAQMGWLLNTGRYPEFERYTREATRKDDLRWQFETGLEHVLDGIAVRLAGKGPRQR